MKNVKTANGVRDERVMNNRTMAADQIYQVSIKLTSRCNMNCQMCEQAKIRQNYDKTEFKCEELKTFLNSDGIESFTDNKHALFHFWGGEPLLRNDMSEIIDVIKEKFDERHFIMINTNGILLHKKAHELNLGKNDIICISLDGHGEVHDAIRNFPGAYDLAFQGINKIRNLDAEISNVKIYVNFTIQRHNFLTIDKLIEDARAAHVNEMQISLPRYYDEKTGNEFHNKISTVFEIDQTKMSLRSDGGDIGGIDIKKLYEKLRTIKEKYREFIFLSFPGYIDMEDYDSFQSFFHGNKHDRITSGYCHQIDTIINIESNGNIMLCPDYPVVTIGNIRDNTIKEMRSDKRRNAYLKFIRNTHSICIRCPHFEGCLA